MTTHPLMTSPSRPPHRSRRSLLRVGLVVAAVAMLVPVVVAVVRLLQAPTPIDRLIVSNPTAYDLTVEVAGGERNGWIPVGTADRHGVTRFDDIIDQGDVWVFRLRAQGEEGGELRTTRNELVTSEWRLEVPAWVGDALAAKGAPPTP